MQRRLTERSLDGGYYLAEQRSAVKARAVLSGAALVPACAQPVLVCRARVALWTTRFTDAASSVI